MKLKGIIVIITDLHEIHCKCQKRKSLLQQLLTANKMTIRYALYSYKKKKKQFGQFPLNSDSYARTFKQILLVTMK